MAFKPVNISFLGKKVIADIKAELRLQGHYDTGFLEGSMIPYEAAVNNEIIIQAYAAAYIKELEEGVPAKKIKISNEEFENLRGWVIRKIGAATPAEATRIAASIVSKWKKEGKPSEGSTAYSENGKILGAIKDAYAANEDGYYKQLDNVVFNEFDLEFDKTKSETI